MNNMILISADNDTRGAEICLCDTNYIGENNSKDISTTFMTQGDFLFEIEPFDED